MTERGLPSMDGAPACPFVAFGDDRDGRATSPDHRHRCFAESPPAPRALAHQEAYCLSSAFPVCPTFQDWARREAAHARGGGDRAETAPSAVPMAKAAASAYGDPAGDEARPETDTAGAAGAGLASAGAIGAAGVAGTGANPPTGPGSNDDPRMGPDGLPPRRNPPRDWAAPPPWAGGAGVGRADAADSAAAAFRAGRSGEGQGLAGSPADRMAGGSAPESEGVMPGAGAGAGLPAAEAGAAGAAAASIWSASAAGSAATSPDDELAGLVKPRAPWAAQAPIVTDAPPRPPRGGRRPAVSSTRPADAIPGPPWERARRYEAYPSLRERAGLPGMPGLPKVIVLAGALAVAALALFMLPALLGIGGGGSSSPTPRGSGSGGPSAIPTITPVPLPTQQVYIIQSKDTLSKVAKKFGVSLADLLAANPDIKNPDKISLGQQIIIPSASSAPSAGASAGSSGSAAP